MTISDKDYFTERTKQTKRRQQLLALVSMVSFFGSITFGGVTTVYNYIHSDKVKVAPLSVEDSLQQEAKGYEIVLRREPNNQMVMEKLSVIRLRLGDVKGAIVILQKLAKQHPERQDYKVVLQKISNPPASATH